MVILFFVGVVGALVLISIYVGFLRNAAREGAGWQAVAVTGLIAGLTAAALTALTAVLSLTTLLDAVPYREPLAMLAFLGIPAAMLGVGAGILGLKSESAYTAAIGLALSALSIAAWVGMQMALGG